MVNLEICIIWSKFLDKRIVFFFHIQQNCLALNFSSNKVSLFRMSKNWRQLGGKNIFFNWLWTQNLAKHLTLWPDPYRSKCFDSSIELFLCSSISEWSPIREFSAPFTLHVFVTFLSIYYISHFPQTVIPLKKHVPKIDCGFSLKHLIKIELSLITDR